MEIPVSSISFAESKMELTVGEQVPLFPVITPGNATNKKLSWSSSKDAVATVTADGIVEAISVGTAFITATSEDGGVNAKCKILVKENVLTVTGEASHISCRNAQLSGKVNLPEITTTNLSFGVLYSTSSGVLLNSAIQLEAKQMRNIISLLKPVCSSRRQYIITEVLSSRMMRWNTARYSPSRPWP